MQTLHENDYAGCAEIAQKQRMKLRRNYAKKSESRKRNYVKISGIMTFEQLLQTRSEPALASPHPQYLPLMTFHYASMCAIAPRPARVGVV